MNIGLDRFVLRMMALIINFKDVRKAAAVLESYRIPVQYLCKGEGTAPGELMDYLGLATMDKAIILCVVPKNHVQELFITFDKALKLNKPGGGIAFTFPISGINSFITKLLNDELQQRILDHFERSESQMADEISHSLLMVAVNQGYSEEVMEAAKEAGGTGGTVLHARRLGAEETLKRWGISIQPEKEIIFILTEHEKKKTIMEAIGNKCGFRTEAQGIVISIPVDAVAGL